MAPELLVGHYSGPYAQHITNRVDIYSLAMVMWEMLHGTTPKPSQLTWVPPE
jgi:serine/threonine protein kinase